MNTPDWATEVVYFKNGDCVFVNDSRYKYCRNRGGFPAEGRWAEESKSEYLDRILRLGYTLRHEHLNVSLENK